MAKFSNRRIRYVNSLKDINNILKIAKDNSCLTHGSCDKLRRISNLRESSYVEDCQKYIKVTTRYIEEVEHKDGSITYKEDIFGGFPCTWMFDKTGAENYHISPGRVAKENAQIYKPFDIVKEIPGLFDVVDGKVMQSAKPILGYSKKFDRTEHQVYCYDLNSAYAMVLRDKIIDTYNMRTDDLVQENEVGFDFTDDLTLVKPGSIADYVFPLIDSPYKEYCDKWYKVKQTAKKGSREKAEAKDRLVVTVGLFQLHNPFLRAYVVGMCNDFIQSIIKKHKEHICCWNTDAVYSDVPLDDLTIGSEIGQFKLEYQGLFRQVGNNYQKVDEKETKYRGICNVLFNDDWNILTDELPVGQLPFVYDSENNIVYER